MRCRSPVHRHLTSSTLLDFWSSFLPLLVSMQTGPAFACISFPPPPPLPFWTTPSGTRLPHPSSSAPTSTQAPSPPLVRHAGPPQRTQNGFPSCWRVSSSETGPATPTLWPTRPRPCTAGTPKAPPGTLANRRAVVQLTHGLQEYWLPAQDSSQHAHTLARLQHWAHELAAHGARESITNSVPLLDSALQVSQGLRVPSFLKTGTGR